jgi:DNA-directed RNA polymerase subunit RPC12/RpoP
MAEVLAEVRCPACESDHMVWRGIENDNRQTESSKSNPAAVIHLWECIRCGENFKQRLE